MYVQTCLAGFPNPCKSGRYEVLGFRATVDNTSAASQVQMWDDEAIKETDKGGYVYTVDGPAISKKTMITSVKGIASSDGNLEVLFPEPLKTRYGISVAFSNIEAGSFLLYVK